MCEAEWMIIQDFNKHREEEDDNPNNINARTEGELKAQIHWRKEINETGNRWELNEKPWQLMNDMVTMKTNAAA